MTSVSQVVVYLLCVVLAAIGVPVVQEQQQPFEIHVFSVGQADSQLIRFPSGFTILYDMGEISWNSKRNAIAVAAELRR